MNELSQFFDVEILNRFTKIMNFNPINEERFTEIVKDVYSRNMKTIRGYSFMPDELPDEDLKTLVKENYNKAFGARPVKRAVQKYIEDKILEELHKKEKDKKANNTDET